MVEKCPWWAWSPVKVVPDENYPKETVQGKLIREGGKCPKEKLEFLWSDGKIVSLLPPHL